MNWTFRLGMWLLKRGHPHLARLAITPYCLLYALLYRLTR